MRILVFVTISLWGTGFAYAQEPPEVLSEAIASTRECRAETEKISLDAWGKPKDQKEILSGRNSGKITRKLAEDPNYIRAMKELQETATVRQVSENSRIIEAKLPQELVYAKLGITFVKLHKLEVTLEQERQGDRWIPKFLEVTIRLWRATLLRTKVHDRYSTKFSCDTR